MSKSHVSLTDDTLVACPGDEGATAGGADDVHGNVDAKEALPPENVTLAKGKRRAQVNNTANHANEASARKRSASQSLHISDQDLDEAYNEEPLEVANNLDEQQEELLAARLARQPVHRERTHTERWGIPPMRAMALCCSMSNSWAHVHLAGGHTSMGAYERHLIKGVSLFIENIEAARCVLFAPHQVPLKEFTRLRKKSETKGGLHPVWGFPSVQPENTSSVAQVTGSLTRELQAEAQLEFILIQRDLRALVLQSLFCRTKCIKPVIEYMRSRLHLTLGLAVSHRPVWQTNCPDVLRQDVYAIGRETRELHGRVNRRVPASALMGLRRSLDALASEAHGHMPSYEPQWAKILRTIVPFKTPHIDGIGSAVPAEGPNGSNEAMLQLVAPNGANQR
ncbi:ATP-binding cassette (ABC) Superfamily [Phytophthora palmivora]|uniref:ATP-binding cassette (ABC) Superfamily n=1 Tax=Phytophthora palmivora TaxID=4796 RepID=A0A2P4XXL3_9STRA|nr:ATP-binding cassette (ABC) Superfamily [Phytophthora palmivora]